MTTTKRRMSAASGILAATAMSGLIAVAAAQAPKPSATKPGTKQPAASAPKPAATTTKPADTKPAATTSKPADRKPADTKPATTATAKPTTTTTTTPPAVAKAAPTELGNQIRAAARNYRAISAGEVAAAKQQLLQAVAVLDAYLGRLGAWGPQWKEYLRWDVLTTELAKNGNYDTAALLKVQRRFSGGFVGLEEPEFRAVGDMLLNFTYLAEAAQNTKLQAEYAEHLNALADAVDAVGNGAPTVAQTAAIGENVAWLRRMGQAPALTAALSSKYSQPNLLVDVSEDLVNDALSRPVDRTEPVVDCILGTYITGTGRTVGNVDVELIENPNQVQITTHLNGTNYSRTVGTNRSALIYSNGRTLLTGDSTLFVNETGLAGGPIQTQARVYNTITGFGSTKRGIIGRLVTKIASKKAPQQKAQGERIAAAHARTRLARSMEKEIAQLVADANDRFTTRFRKPLERFGQYPAHLQYASTPQAIEIRAVQTTTGRFAAPGAPPQLAGAPISLRMHQSLVTNSTQGMLAGRKFDQQRIELLAESILGEVPARLRAPEGEEPFSITFADEDPVSVSFADDVVTFTIRGKAFTNGDKTYTGQNITGRYKLTAQGRGFKAVRQGDFDIVPPGYQRGTGKSLPTRDIVFKSVLTKKFGKAFPAEIVREGTQLEGEASELGTLYVSSIKADGDWLVVGLQREAKGPALPQTAAAAATQTELAANE